MVTRLALCLVVVGWGAACQRQETPGAAAEGPDAAADAIPPGAPDDRPYADGATAGGPTDATPGGPSPDAAADAATATAPDARPAADAATAGRCGLAGATALKSLSPKLFSQGANPSADPECTGVLNPERGFFEFRDLRKLGAANNLRARGFTLIYGQILIPEYRARDLDQPLLDQLTASFAALRAAGVKVLPRIYYADGMEADAQLARVLAHIQQLTPVLRANADVIAVLHPGFVGAWGEWHASTNGLTDPAARRQIYDALLTALPADRMTMSRRPSFKKEAYGGPLTAATAFTDQPLARVGHLNDCFLASENDVGTYQSPGEEAFAQEDSAFVPVGGETCGEFPPRSACPSALAELARFHWSFLNIDYEPNVIQGFRTGGCFGTIQCRLGYRLLALHHETPARVKRGETLAVSLRVVNDGFGRVYNPRPVQLVLVGPQRQVFAVEADPRRWAPGEAVDLCLSATIPATLPAGEYQVGVALPDAAPALKGNPAYAVRFSNLSWDAATGTNLLDARVVVE